MTANEQALESLHHVATDIFLQALDTCSIESAFDRRIRFEGTQLHRLLSDGSSPASIDLKNYRSIYVIAIGKAAVPMLNTLLSRMRDRKSVV